MEGSLITRRVTQIAEDALRDGPIDLVHVEIAGTKRDAVVRIYIDKEGGVTLDDCSAVSHKVEAVLDGEDLIPWRYVLEVSSPGIERQLYSLGDFTKFIGRIAKLKTRIEIDGQKNFVGTIESVHGTRVGFNDRTRGRLSFEYADIEKANLKIDLAKEFGR